MLMIRLMRVGRRNDPSFRVVVTDARNAPKSGKYLEMVGSYNPRVKSVALKGERIRHWLSVGAKASGTVHNLLVSEGILEGKKINVLPRKSPPAGGKLSAETAGAAEPVGGAEKPEGAPAA